MLREKGDWNAGNERKYAVFQNHEPRTLHIFKQRKAHRTAMLKRNHVAKKESVKPIWAAAGGGVFEWLGFVLQENLKI